MENINDYDIYKNTLTIPYPYTTKDAKHWIKHNLKLHRQKNPKEINFVIDINGEVAGSVSLMNIDRPHNKAELGAWLSKKYWNKGIMTKALKRIMKYGFNSVKLNRIYGQIFTFNKASQRMAEKAGLKLEGRLRKSVRKKGRYYDDLMYAKVR